jgi:flagellar basal body-associated protein FliL
VIRARNATELAILCATGLIALALVTIPFSPMTFGSTKPMLFIAIAAVLTIAVGVGGRYLIAKNQTKAELTSGQQYRQLADEYRRLADLAITTQEHTDLKLGDVGVQLDYLREKIESLQKILEDVE